MLVALAMALSLSPDEPSDLKNRGFEMLEQIRREYYLPKSKLYCDSVEISSEARGAKGDGDAPVNSESSNFKLPTSNLKQSGPAFNWGAGVMLSALNAAARLDPKYKKWLRDYADATRVYWNDKGPVPGYDVLPCPKPVDRYYDDNAWMVLALVETHEILGDKKYLDWAEQALDYVLSGEDNRLGGGIYWRESDKKSKNACSNAPSAAACLRLSRHRRTMELSDKAFNLLEWTRNVLQDPADGLFWDNISLNSKIDKTKWSYNTGLYLSACGLYNLHPEDGERQKILRSAIDRWTDPGSGAIKDTGRFAHLLLEGIALQRMYASTRHLLAKPISNGLAYLWAHCRNPQGRFGDMWDRPFDPKRTKFELIDQASVVRAHLFAAATTSR